MALETIGLQPISIDVYKKHKQTTIYANEADVNGRGLLVTLVNNGTPIDSTGVTLRMGFLNNANEQKIYDFTLVDASTGKYSIHYPTELLNQSGGSVKQVEIKAYEGENVITYLPLYLYVNDAVVTDEGLEATNEGSALLKALNEYEGVNSAYILAEQNRDLEYSSAEANRGASYTIVEANRDSLYNAAESERNSDYDSAEASRGGLYNTAESARNGLYNAAENARGVQYESAESARDALYQTAESNRDVLLNSVNAQLAEIENEINNIVITPSKISFLAEIFETNEITKAVVVSDADGFAASQVPALIKDHNVTYGGISPNANYNALKLFVNPGDIIRSKLYFYHLPSTSSASTYYITYFNAEGIRLGNELVKWPSSTTPNLSGYIANGATVPANVHYCYVSIAKNYYQGDSTYAINGKEAEVITINQDKALTEYAADAPLSNYEPIEEMIVSSKDILIPRYEDILTGLEDVLSALVDGGGA